MVSNTLIDHGKPVTKSVEAVYWAAEHRRHEYAEWVAQQAQALAGEAETNDDG